MGITDGRQGATLLDDIWGQAATGGTLTILGPRERRQTKKHTEIVDRAEAAARGLARRGVEPGHRVAVVVSTSFDAIASVLAVWRAGATAVILPPRARTESRTQWDRRIAALVRRVGARLVVSDDDVPSAPEQAGVRFEDLLAAPGDAPPAPTGTSPALIKFTSGTTSDPRAIVKSHAALLAGARSSIATKGGLDRRVDHRVGWAPLHRHALGTDVLYPMALGVRATLLPTELFTARPLRWLSEISTARGTYSSGPNFAYRLVAHLLEASRDLDLDLSCWRIAQCGGEAVDPVILERFAAAAAPYGFDPRSLAPSYGATETGGITACPPGHGLSVDRVDRHALALGRAEPSPTGPPDAVAVVSVGPPRTGVMIKIVADGVQQPERRVGEVLVRTPGVMDGYLDDPAATAAVMQDGWFRTGDRGYLADGELHITGRIKDTIIVHGQSFYATDIERVVASLDEVEPAECAAIGVREGDTEALVLVVEANRPDAALAEAVTKGVWEQVGLAPRNVVLVPPGSLPRTHNGKLQRAEVRSRYDAGDLLGPPATPRPRDATTQR